MMTRCTEEYPYTVEKWEKDVKPLVIDGVYVGKYIDYSTYSNKIGINHVFKMKTGFEITVPQNNICIMSFNWDCDTPTTIVMMEV